jgi:hypothetical protein
LGKNRDSCRLPTERPPTLGALILEGASKSATVLRLRLYFANKLIQALESVPLFRVPQLRGIQSPAQNRKQLIISLEGDSERVTILAA